MAAQVELERWRYFVARWRESRYLSKKLEALRTCILERSAICFKLWARGNFLEIGPTCPPILHVLCPH